MTFKDLTQIRNMLPFSSRAAMIAVQAAPNNVVDVASFGGQCWR